MPKVSTKVIYTFFLLLFFILLTTISRILTPFLIAAIAAYILNPVVKALSKKMETPHTVSVFLTYSLFIAFNLIVLSTIGGLFVKESSELSRELVQLRRVASQQIENYPEWTQILMYDLISRFDVNHIFDTNRLWPYFSGAVTGITSILIFLIATFYFLKDGERFVAKSLKSLFKTSKYTSSYVKDQINLVLNNYLRGQIFLVFLMASITWLILALLGVKYALILGIFTGIAEIVPIVGPIIAGAVAVLTAMFDGNAILGFPPVFEGILIALIYLILRQLEDVLVIPYVLGRTTKLHPLAILFAVLVGGHFCGIVGIIVAIPTVALLKVLIDHL